MMVRSGSEEGGSLIWDPLAREQNAFAEVEHRLVLASHRLLVFAFLYPTLCCGAIEVCLLASAYKNSTVARVCEGAQDMVVRVDLRSSLRLVDLPWPFFLAFLGALLPFVRTPLSLFFLVPLFPFFLGLL